jgi:hypothetical protein
LWPRENTPYRLRARIEDGNQLVRRSFRALPLRRDRKGWLDGFYLDVPEEWDDPYRFFQS